MSGPRIVSVDANARVAEYERNYNFMKYGVYSVIAIGVLVFTLFMIIKAHGDMQSSDLLLAEEGKAMVIKLGCSMVIVLAFLAYSAYQFCRVFREPSRFVEIAVGDYLDRVDAPHSPPPPAPAPGSAITQVLIDRGLEVFSGQGHKLGGT